ncbi:MAG: tetratricopeptide repeat protein [Candidatus Sumerlaeia bacterium]
MKVKGLFHFPRIHHRKHAFPLIILAVFYAIGIFLWFDPWRGDGYAPVFHNQFIASLLLDGNVDLANEHLMARNPLDVPETAAEKISPTGYVAEAYPLGPPILIAPFWLLFHGLGILLKLAGEGDRFAPHYLYASSLSSLFYGFCAILLIWRTAFRFIPSPAALVVGLVSLFGTSAVLVSYKAVAFSPVYAMSAGALFLYACIESTRRHKGSFAFYIILAAGLMLLCDWRSFVFFLVPLGVWLEKRTGGTEIMSAEGVPPDQTPEADAGVSSFSSDKEAETPVIDADFEPLTEDMPDTLNEAGGASDFFSGASADETSLGSSEMPVPEVQDLEPLAVETRPPEKPARLKAVLRYAGIFLVICSVLLLIFSPQMIYWKKAFDSYVLLPRIPQDITTFGEFAHISGLRALEAVLGQTGGFFYWFPLASLGLLGLLLMALRRSLIGGGAFLAVILYVLITNLSWQWQATEAIWLGRYAILVPFVALGLAQLFLEVRFRSTQTVLALFLCVVAAWTLCITITHQKSPFEISPWPWDVKTWQFFSESIFKRPMSYFGDSILVRFLTQSPPPLETLVSLLLLVLFFPTLVWVATRHILPVVRRYYILRVFGIGIITLLIGLNVLLLRSDIPGDTRRAHLRLRAIVGSGGSLVSPSPVAPDLQTLAEDDDDALTYFYIAETLRRQGDQEEARYYYQQLTLRDLHAGWLGMLRTADSAEEKREALGKLTEKSPTHVALVYEYTNMFSDLGLKREARKYLDMAFPPAEDYWRIRAQLSSNSEETERFLQKARVFAPVNPENQPDSREPGKALNPERPMTGTIDKQMQDILDDVLLSDDDETTTSPETPARESSE